MTDNTVSVVEKDQDKDKNRELTDVEFMATMQKTTEEGYNVLPHSEMILEIDE